MTQTLSYAKAEDVEISKIPVIDVRPFLTGSAAERQAVADAIGDACRRIGFFYVVGHDVPAGLRADVLSQARRFFERSFDDKMKSAPRPHQRCGFLPSRGAAEGKQAGESLAVTGAATGADGMAAPPTPAKTPGGLLEQFTAMRELPADDPDQLAGVPLHAPNIWPVELPGFRDIVIAYQRETMALARELLRALAMALRIDPEFFVDLHRKPLANFGFNHYPPPQTPGDDVGVGAHADTSTITVLLQDDVGGLEVQNREGRWITAPPAPGAYVVNIGEVMMNWTNGEFVSTLHRVTSRKPVDRYSITLFMSPDFEATVGPIPTSITPDRPRKYEPVHNGRYMTKYFDTYYGRLFETRRELFARYGLL